ncbi:MAG: NfeD family protein [Planctomycetota bacterium]|nr:NfeD family protein [Planctomycetota bacterium]
MVLNLFLLWGFCLPQADLTSKEVEQAPVYAVALEGALQESWASILRRAEQEALLANAEIFVLELDTPGGEIQLMKRLGERLDSIGESMETICLVQHQALSAGSFLAMACERIMMRPGASMGAAMPIQVGPGGIMPELDEDVREKMNSAFRAEFRSWAELHNRDPRIAEAFVDSSIELKRVSHRGEQKVVSGQEFHDLLQKGETPRFLETVCAAGDLLTLTAEQAIEFGYCDGMATDIDSVLMQLGLSDRTVHRIEANWSESLVQFIGSWSWLLMLASAFFVVLAFNMPGMGAPELAAAITMGIFLFHGYLVGLAEWTEVLLVVSGLIFLAVEIFVMPGTIFTGAIGGVLLLGGLLLAMQDFVLPDGAIQKEAFQSNLLTLLSVFLVAPCLAIYTVRKLVKTRVGSFLATSPSDDFGGPIGKIDTSNLKNLIGQEGVSRTPLRPAGVILIQKEPYDAVSTGDFLESGSLVRVIGKQGPSLLVQAVK